MLIRTLYFYGFKKKKYRGQDVSRNDLFQYIGLMLEMDKLECSATPAAHKPTLCNHLTNQNNK